ncbi:Phosphoribosylglycinamide formyltransferase [Bacteroides pyogenes]|uniref:Phosphoribosylglycinamide formyltransferase n=2 Tax=Bacteroides pyogenes TaxID=310300 RepID=W4PED5_9BACE|nr:phosphoribosylglycinamide formyltransferase [Bacteroides pyogenes]GAE14784.1 phosphoribosylglycinamide formyltransferase [Bacteroides pyogenes JCM 6292]MBR8725267.1 Phosphoribosylglycinamide formyltransferase [Bacteroides pyogenes]MBR8738735.1 Phosphoribosylglycinamide formyltransferase [Bacteroides pyogenes]MBR8754459.1 Phosphoribosylglycinamide formyltransferase [Bacteroides pyogenes]MBR8795836.1 Phosphoribosylglycinamide formyltransferase [Bacteroides pyogenes]
MKKNIAIFASGSGTNAENIIRYFQRSEFVRVSLVVSNKPDAYVLERAHRLRIPSYVFLNEDWIAGDKILAVLQAHQIHFVVLAGFLLRVPLLLLNAFPRRIINIHPALLPKFGGKGMYGDRVHRAVVDSGETESGITIHYINERYDEGDVIFQTVCPVFPGDSAEDVAKKVHALEHHYFPKVIEELLECGQD